MNTQNGTKYVPKIYKLHTLLEILHGNILCPNQLVLYWLSSLRFTSVPVSITSTVTVLFPITNASDRTFVLNNPKK